MRKIKPINKTAIIILISFCLSLYMLKRINDIASPILMDFALKDSYNTVNKIVNSAVNTVIENNFNMDELFILLNDKDGNVISIDFDSIMLNKVITLISLEIEKQLYNMEEKDYKIPFTVIFKNNFLNNIGPKVPIKVKLIGGIINNFETKITNYGINNALIELCLKLELRISVALPFVSDDVVISNVYPLALKLINGNIPEYYAGNATNPLLSLPIK